MSKALGFSVGVVMTGFHTSDGPDRNTLEKAGDGWKYAVQTVDRKTDLKAGVYVYATGGAPAGVICGVPVCGALFGSLKKKGAAYLESLAAADRYAVDRAWLRSLEVSEEAVAILVDQGKLTKQDILGMTPGELDGMLGDLPVVNRVRIVNAGRVVE